ncbi:hypothetical protein [Enterococcus saccharolyticus]|uniref:hypothetical protein n=1 Tax=Enterococcus saccharolyticus TaxID=41997 RepID=UPI0039E0F67F
MIAYLKSENYRFLRKKNFYMISIACFSLLIAAGSLLRFFGRTESTFPYANAKFFYTNVVSAGGIILFVALLVNLILTGNDCQVLKQSISFGLSRKKIFLTKLSVTMGYFLGLCLLGIGTTVLVGELLFPYEAHVLTAYMLSLVNMAPLIISGFILAHSLMMLGVKEIIICGILIFIYSLSDTLLIFLSNYIDFVKMIADYAPSTLLTTNLNQFMSLTTSFNGTAWLVGVILSCVALIVGMKQFEKKSIV